MKEFIQFSIIIPAFDEEEYISESIRSVQKQQGDFDTEIIVVNNASTDKTGQIARSLGVLVVDEPRKGVGQARKTGTEMARGEYVLHIDADTHLPEDYLLQVKKRFDNDPKLVCLGGQFYFYDASPWKNILRFFSHWGLWFFSRIVSLGTIGAMGNNMTFKKNIYNKTSGFNGDLKYGEDMDMCRKLSRFGRIRLDMNLKCHVSVRRFVFDKRLFVYAVNFFKMSLFGRPYKNTLSGHK